MVPVSRINIQILKRADFRFFSHPKYRQRHKQRPEELYGRRGSRGKEPRTYKYLDHLPKAAPAACQGRHRYLKRREFPKKATADVTTIAIEIYPPSITDTNVSSLASGRSALPFHTFAVRWRRAGRGYRNDSGT